MKLACWNVNGIRAAERKGELDKFVKKQKADIILLQETKSKLEQVETIVKKYSDYTQFYHSAEKPGYAGTTTWIKKDLKHDFKSIVKEVKCNEGRIIQLDIDGYSILNIYFPNGGKSQEAWEGKLVFYEEFLQYISKLTKNGRKVIWCGDVNCAHNEIDLARPKDNDGKIGFHPKERAWIDKLIKEGWVDVFRSLHPDKIIYSYWHLISRARSRNVGWRIDYFFLKKDLLKQVKKIEYDNDQQGSDHCPVIMEIDF